MGFSWEFMWDFCAEFVLHVRYVDLHHGSSVSNTDTLSSAEGVMDKVGMPCNVNVMIYGF